MRILRTGLVESLRRLRDCVASRAFQIIREFVTDLLDKRGSAWSSPVSDVKERRMDDDIDAIISALRERLSAETDADLARKLRIDKSTISSWRSRRSVPNRFRKIASGESHQMMSAPPMG